MRVTVEERKPVPSDWAAVDDLLRLDPGRWGSLSWISSRSLVDSVNHLLSLGTDGLVDQLRQAWVGPDQTPPPPEAGTVVEPRDFRTLDADELGALRIIDRRTDTRFLVVGDPGEQDPSQYVVSPPLSTAAQDCGFVLIMSDVVYPAGDVDDYEDAVYKAYRHASEKGFRIRPPLIGLPGNHDWYDGLAGFMYHFCGRDRLPRSAYSPQQETKVLGRLFRILWRFPPAPRRRTGDLRETTPITAGTDGDRITQPGPYYGVRTKNLLLVCIDTGIGGNIDEQQWNWLEQVSALEGSKVLVTGKPLVANARRVPCHVGHRKRISEQYATVWDLVQDPDHEYVATMGGDTHNYQRYAQHAPGAGPQVHLVSGGGGAYTHASHPYATADLDSRVRRDTKRPFFDLPQATFPAQPTSLHFFTRLLVPSVLRTLRFLLLMITGALAVLGAVCSGLGGQVPVITSASVLGLLLLGAVRMVGRKAPRESPFARTLTAAAGLLLGALAAGIAYGLDPDHFTRFVTWWLVLTAYHCVFTVALRRSGWWRPKVDFRRRVWGWAFVLGLLALSLTAGALVRLADPGDGWWWPMIGTLIPLVLGGAGAFVRRKESKIEFWTIAGSVAAPLIQLIVAVLVLCRLTRSSGLDWLVPGAFGSVVLTLVITAVSGGLVLVLTEVVAWLVARRRHGVAGARASSWGAVARVTHHLPIPLLLAGAVAWIAIWADASPVRQVASGLPVVVFTVTGLLLFVGLLRRKLRTRYFLVLALALAVLLGLALVQVFGLRDLAVVEYLRTDWAPRVVLGTAVVLLALLTSIALGHLFFLNAHLLLWPGYWRQPYFANEEEAALFIEARRADDVKRPAKLSRKAWLAGRITWPGLDEPGGPLQGKVSEVYSSDIPPFHKNFLQFDSDPTDLTITVHRIAVPKPGTAPGPA